MGVTYTLRLVGSETWRFSAKKYRGAAALVLQPSHGRTRASGKADEPPCSLHNFRLHTLPYAGSTGEGILAIQPRDVIAKHPAKRISSFSKNDTAPSPSNSLPPRLQTTYTSYRASICLQRPSNQTLQIQPRRSPARKAPPHRRANTKWLPTSRDKSISSVGFRGRSLFLRLASGDCACFWEEEV
jgi:hypothetical protein